MSMRDSELHHPYEQFEYVIAALEGVVVLGCVLFGVVFGWWEVFCECLVYPEMPT